MTPEQLKSIIEEKMDVKDVAVSGEGNMFDVRVVADAFAGKTPVKKQQMVYALVNDYITSGEIHALGIKAYTPEEWEKASKLQIIG